MSNERKALTVAKLIWELQKLDPEDVVLLSLHSSCACGRDNTHVSGAAGARASESEQGYVIITEDASVEHPFLV